MAEERRLDRSVAESKDRFGRDYISALYGSEIPPDNMEELLKSGEPNVESERGRIVVVASDRGFKAEMEATRSSRSKRAILLMG
ncbi:MAG: hypothetical protein QW057_08680 [Candidatus Bathyarchaeia archaeon]